MVAMDNPKTYRKCIYQFAKDNYSVPEVKFIVDNFDVIKVEPITSSGVVNYIYRVVCPCSGKSIIIKYGEVEMRTSPGEGDEFHIPITRQKVEFEVLKIFQKCQPGSVPEPYCFDEKHQMMAIEDLSAMHLLHDDVHEGKVDVDLAYKLGQLEAQFHNATHKNSCPPETWQFYMSFLGEDCRETMLRVRFGIAFQEQEGFNSIHPDCLETFRKYKQAIDDSGALNRMRELYQQDICVCHIDIHTQSVFVDELRIAVFDCEWAAIGHPASEVALIITWYTLILLELVDKDGTDSSGVKTNFKHAIGAIVKGYTDNSTIYGKSSESQDTFLTDLTGFIGSYLFAHSHYTNMYTFAALTPEKKNQASKLGADMMVYSQVESVKDIPALISILFQDL